jgi:hypothetical protein
VTGHEIHRTVDRDLSLKRLTVGGVGGVSYPAPIDTLFRCGERVRCWVDENGFLVVVGERLLTEHWEPTVTEPNHHKRGTDALLASALAVVDTVISEMARNGHATIDGESVRLTPSGKEVAAARFGAAVNENAPSQGPSNFPRTTATMKETAAREETWTEQRSRER